MDSLEVRQEEIGRVLSKKGASNIFKYYAVDQPLASIDFMSEEKDYKEVIYPAKSFFEIMRRPFDGFYYYASGGIELLNIGDPGTPETHKSMTFPSHLKTYSKLGQVNFWLGKKNVTAYTHYDTSYNLHFMARGSKEFILIPPSAYSKLRLFPCLHQLYRQASFDIFSGNHDLNEFLREINGLRVELQDGDTLYIPPYWFHSVITMETTISLNIWSQSESFLKMEEIYKSPIPFEAEWGKAKLMKALNFFIRLLTNEILIHSEETIDVTEFLLHRVYSRYEAIFEWRRNMKASSKIMNLKQIVYNYCLRTSITEILDDNAVKYIEDRVKRIGEHFLEIEDSAVREINLANYIEHLVWRILGTKDLLQLPVYLKECFKNDIT